MRAKERLNEIIKILNKQGRVHVRDLSSRFQVTEDLIRKDLKKLELEGLIDRIHGGAERKKQKFDAPNIRYRMQVNQTDKTLIAQKAIKLIKNGDTIFLDTSSTCLSLAKALAQSSLELTVITNMLDAVHMLEDQEDIRLVLVGGLYNRQMGGFFGQDVIEGLGAYQVDYSFISCTGIDLDQGCLLSSTKDIAYTKKVMLDNSRQRVCLLETRKFNNQGLVKFYDLEGLDYLVLDKPYDLDDMDVKIL